MSAFTRSCFRVSTPERQTRQNRTPGILVALLLSMVCLTTGNILAQSASEAILPPFRMDPELPQGIVLNPEQGLGQCHWFDQSIVTQPYVGWAYDASTAISSWSTIEPEDGEFVWGAMDGLIAKARNVDRRLWLELLTTEGQVPDWARNEGVVLVGSRGGTPVPWNETYPRLLRRAVHAMAARYDSEPTVDAINVMAGGCYGEMTICNAPQDRSAWLDAGYTDERFIEAVKQIIDIYLEDDYEWEDGSHTHGFQRKPIVLQLGGGLFGHTTKVIEPVVEYAVAKYGMRVWLKFNGLGGGSDMGWLFERYGPHTRVGYEPMGNSVEFLAKPEKFMRLVLDHHASYICLQGAYYNVADQPWRSAREMVARYLGSQIVLLQSSIPDTLPAGRSFELASQWVNRGTVPLAFGERQETREVPTSYYVSVSLVLPSTGISALDHVFTPDPPTTLWHSASPVTVTAQIRVPQEVPGGQYDIRLALVRPDRVPGDAGWSFRLINAGDPDSRGRYTVGQLTILATATPTVLPSATPTASRTPTVQPTPPPGGGGSVIDRLQQTLHALIEWLRNLLRRG